MANTDVDTIIYIYRIASELRLGQSSSFTTTAHPGTNKTISGWKWDERVWSSVNELEASAYAPTIWDPTLSGLDTDYFQSGYGDNQDLQLLNLQEVQVSGESIWAAKINHGYYYINDKQHYLFSDQHITESVLLSNVVSGTQYHTLQYDYKPTIPILVRGYTFNTNQNEYVASVNVRKRVEFSGSSEPEFTIDTTASPPQLVFNQILNSVIGTTVSGTDGATSTYDIQELEYLGFSNGGESQEFLTTFSPIDQSQPIEIWTWENPNEGYQWTLLSGLDEFSVGNNREVRIDYNRGILQFGNYDTSTGSGRGRIPDLAHKIGIYYTKGLEVQYEPEGSIDYILAYNSNVNINPVKSGTQYGFIQLTTVLPDPASIVLTSTLTQENPFLIDLGNLTGELFATVYTSNGIALNGQAVTFEILEPQLGTFGGTTTETVAITADNGTAQTLYHSPATINNLGSSADNTDVIVGGGQTVIDFDGLVDTGTVSGLYLYKLHTYDTVLGISESDLSTYYTNYIAAENIVSGEQATQAYEEEFRSHHELATPTTYASGDITTGKKTLIMTTQPNGVMDPHTGQESASTYIPLFPISTTDIGTDTAPVLRVTYDTELPVPGTGDTRAYFGVGESLISIRAYVTHPRTGGKIYSNTIDIKIQLPDSINGTFFADALSNIPDNLLKNVIDINDPSDGSINATSGVDTLYQEYLYDRYLTSGVYEDYKTWFRRTRVGDTVGLTTLAEDIPDPTLSGLIDVEPQTPTTNAIIPVGFRLKSTGVTVASILDQITYIDPNHLLSSGVFDVDY